MLRFSGSLSSDISEERGVSLKDPGMFFLVLLTLHSSRPLCWACVCTIAGPVAQCLNSFPEQTDVQSDRVQGRGRVLPLLPLFLESMLRAVQ